jgi:hypothetical protein
VSYNPISLEYHQNANGEALAREDAKAMVGDSIFHNCRVKLMTHKG